MGSKVCIRRVVVPMKKWQLVLATAAMSAVVIAPATEAAETTYTVQKGDTLYKIATKYDTTVAKLQQLNSLQDHTIYFAQEIKVPAKAIAVGNTNNSVKNNAAPAMEPSIYIVVKGDNLSKIATKNSTTVANIKEWNQLKTDVIYVGQALMIHQARPIIVESATQMSIADQEIANQLAKEKANKKGLSSKAKKHYEKALTVAHSLMGTPYVFGGSTPEGIDCSGFVYYTYQNAGYNIARKSSLDYFMKDTTKVDKPQPGDLVFFKNTYIPTISHMGIYIGNNQFIHAGSNGVEISNMTYNYWDSRFVAFKRFNIVK